MSFEATFFAQRVVFGAGRVSELGAVCDALGLGRVAVLTGAVHAELGRETAARLGTRGGLCFAGAVEHTPVEVTDAAELATRDAHLDGLVAIGGGAATGLGKALAARGDLPLIAVPTTYAGSEMTPVVGERRDGVKTTRRDGRVLPRAVIYDPDLAATMPAGLAAASGMNALAHAFGALLAPDATPFSDREACESIYLLARNLPDVVSGRGGVAEALLGAAFAGRCLAATTMGLHHRLCHLLGGSFGLPHAATHAALLPAVLEAEARRDPRSVAKAAPALECATAEEVVEALYRLQRQIDAPGNLSGLGLTADGVARAAAAASGDDPEAEERLRELLERALVGR